MDFKIPTKFYLGGVEHTVSFESVMTDCGLYDPISKKLTIAEKVDLRTAPPSARQQTFFHELTHAILDAMGHRLYSDEAFVNTFSSFLNEVISTMEE